MYSASNLMKVSDWNRDYSKELVGVKTYKIEGSDELYYTRDDIATRIPESIIREKECEFNILMPYKAQKLIAVN